MAFSRFQKRRFRGRRMHRRSLGKKHSKFGKIKRDLAHLNFSRKVKIMGLTEYKTMYLRETGSIDLSSTKQWDSIVLRPDQAQNLNTLYSVVTRDKESVKVPNWEKFRVTAVYVHVQPIYNTFDETTGQIHNVESFYSVGSLGSALANSADAKSYHNVKETFTFSTNDNFTFVIRAPESMECTSGGSGDGITTSIDSIAVYPRYQWWSLKDMMLDPPDFQANEASEYSEDDVEAFPASNQVPAFGELVFRCKESINEKKPIKLLVDVQYKIQLRG